MSKRKRKRANKKIKTVTNLKRMARLTISSPACIPFLSPNALSATLTCNLHTSSNKRSHNFKVQAQLGGGEGDAKKTGKKKFITREEEPDQYWQTAGERKGENPMTTPLPYIIIFGMSTPFVILAIAFLNGWIKVPVR